MDFMVSTVPTHVVPVLEVYPAIQLMEAAQAAVLLDLTVFCVRMVKYPICF